MTNVLAGPCCTRMFVELGAAVTRVDVMDPQQPPTIHVLWSGENSVGKRSIILERRKPEGLGIIHQITGRADIVCCSKMDDQMGRLGVDAASLGSAIRAPSAYRLPPPAASGRAAAPRKGYDPSIQGTTGVMMRFGGPETPTFHGFASAVDYLCGYLGTLSGVIALYARERRGDERGDWAETSLCNAATLLQLLFQRAGSDAPASARGQLATGMTAGERVYQLGDGWISHRRPATSRRSSAAAIRRRRSPGAHNRVSQRCRCRHARNSPTGIANTRPHGEVRKARE